MAYGEKYRLIFDSIYSKSKQNSTGTTATVFKASIYQNGWSTAPVDVTGSSNPVIIETDRGSEIGYRPIMAMKATFTMVVDSTFDVSQFMTCSGTDYYLLVQKGTRTDVYTGGHYSSSSYSWTETVYKGFYVPITDVSIPDVPPYEFRMTFSDGFHFLKNSLYYQGSSEQPLGFRAGDKITLHQLITDALAATNMGFPFATSFFFENSGIGHTGSKRQLESIYVYKNALLQDAGTYYTYYEILQAILTRFGLMCYQYNGTWYIMDYKEMTNGTTNPRITTYNAAGVYQSTPTTVTFDALTVNGTTFRQSGQSQINRLGLPKRFISFTTDFKKFIKTGVKNDEFQAWSSSTVLYNWVTFGGGTIANRFTLSTGRYAAQVTGTATPTKYLISNNVSVKAGDTILIDWSQNTIYTGTNLDTAIFLQGDDGGSYFLQTDGSFTSAVNKFNATTASAASISPTIKIPVSGLIRAEIYQGTSDGYFEFFKVQVRGGSDSGTDAAGINNINSMIERGSSSATFTSGDTDFTNSFYNYDPLVLPNNYISASQNSASNTTAFISYMTDSNMNVLPDTWYYDNSAGADYLYVWVLKNMAKNVMQNFVVIEGSFVTTLNPLNKFFSYTMISVGTKKYICMDFKWDLKMAEVDATLYSVNLITSTPTITPIKYLNYNS
jgi:hypothetical protein